jgi:hypothetical protein
MQVCDSNRVDYWKVVIVVNPYPLGPPTKESQGSMMATFPSKKKPAVHARSMLAHIIQHFLKISVNSCCSHHRKTILVFSTDRIACQKRLETTLQQQRRAIVTNIDCSFASLARSCALYNNTDRMYTAAAARRRNNHWFRQQCLQEVCSTREHNRRSTSDPDGTNGQECCGLAHVGSQTPAAPEPTLPGTFARQ